MHACTYACTHTQAPTANGPELPKPAAVGPPPTTAVPTTEPARAGSINLGNFASQAQRLNSADTISSASSLSRGGWALAADSDKRASSMEDEGPTWTGNVMFQNAMFSDHSRWVGV